jgi:hypothetical protein
MVKPAYEDWQSDPLTEWKAQAAVANGDLLAERLVEYWKALKNLTLIAGRGTAYKYRSYLRGLWPEFGLVWDVHDGTKHFALDRGTARSPMPIRLG